MMIQQDLACVAKGPDTILDEGGVSRWLGGWARVQKLLSSVEISRLESLASWKYLIE